MSTLPSKSEMSPLMALLEPLYAPLIKKLNLTPEQSRSFYELLLDAKAKRQAQVTDLLRHEDSSRTATALAEIQKVTETSLQALLGATGFVQYREYQSSVGDRGQLELWKRDFAEAPLIEDQQQQLLKAMESARKTVGNPTSDSNVGFSIADTPEVMNEKLNRQQSIDHHVLQQAARFLSPAQLQILSSAQARMMNARQTGYAQAREAFGERRQER